MKNNQSESTSEQKMIGHPPTGVDTPVIVVDQFQK